MSKVIWKFPIPVISQSCLVSAPDGCKWLSVQCQGNDHIANTVAWAECDPDETIVVHEFAFVPTGLAEVPAGQYLGTIQYEGGALVFHVYIMT